MKSKKGFTLVEAVASIAMLGLIAVLVMSSFMAQYRTVNDNAANKQKDKSAQSVLEKDVSGVEVGNTQVDHVTGNFKIDFGGSEVSVNGDYISGSDEDDGYSYKYFEPGE